MGNMYFLKTLIGNSKIRFYCKQWIFLRLLTSDLEIESVATNYLNCLYKHVK